MDDNKTNTVEIVFGNHLMALLEITDNEVKVIAAVNGWGNPVDLETIKINQK